MSSPLNRLVSDLPKIIHDMQPNLVVLGLDIVLNDIVEGVTPNEVQYDTTLLAINAQITTLTEATKTGTIIPYWPN